MTRISQKFPNPQNWPVVPPDEYWLERWHWLKTEDGDMHLASWTHQFGWHFDWSGKADPPDMIGWTYASPARPPLSTTPPRAVQAPERTNAPATPTTRQRRSQAPRRATGDDT